MRVIVSLVLFIASEASHHFVFSAFQLRALCLQTAKLSVRKELFEVFLPRPSGWTSVVVPCGTAQDGHLKPGKPLQFWTR